VTGGSTGASGSAGTNGGGGSGGATATAGAGSGGGGGAGEAGAGPSLWPPVTDFEAAGTFTAATLTGVGPNSNYTVHYPMQPGPNGAKNPIVGWMSGGGTTQDLYVLLPHLASHGFVVVASNSIPGIGAEIELGKEIIAGIDWAIAENERMGSMLFGRLDTTKLASAGYSMGSLATFTIAADPRLTTTVHISGGNFEPERVMNLRAPAAFICGATGDASCTIVNLDCDIAAPQCDVDFMGATTPVFYAKFAAGHLGILTPPFTERIGGMTTAWLRYKLMGDTTLATRFVGADCAYCKDTNWNVQQKGMF
jgi:hypothetical protein